MSRQNRKSIIQSIEQKRGSKVITFVTSDRAGLPVKIAGDIVSIIHDHILALQEEERKKLDLFIYSRGGQSDVPWQIVSMLREYCEEGFVGVLIPYRAHSAATVIALGADEIVMTKKAELGPIDITIESGPHNPIDKDSKQRLPISVEDVRGYFSLLKKVGCNKREERMKGFELISNQVHPLALGTVSRLLEETKLVGLRLLSTRAVPFSEKKNREIIRRLSSEVYSHGHSISRTEAVNDIGLKQVKDAEEVGIEDDLWNLYMEYRALFQLETPFRPEEYLISNNLEEHSWNNLNLACIESYKRSDICKQDMRVRRLRKIPPQVNVNLANIGLPAVNIPNLPPNMNQQQFTILIKQLVEAVVQQSLDTAVQTAVEELIKSLPQAGFERISFNGGWRRGR